MASKTYAQAIEALKKDPQTYADTVAGQIERIDDSKVVIVNKLVNMVGIEADSQIDDAAISLDGVVIATAGTTTIKPGQDYVVPTGYYKGDVTIHADTEGGDLKYQEKTATPTKAQQVVTPDTGYHGLSKVTVNKIPDAYQDVTAVTATAADVLTSKKFVNSSGAIVDGSMVNNGTVTKVLDATQVSGEYTNSSLTIAKGYHSGSGTVSIVLEEKSATPTESAQTITPTSGKVLGKVSVAAIDKDTYLTKWTTDADAVSSEILTGKTAYVDGAKVTGTMVDNSDWDAADHVLTAKDGQTTSINIPIGYHDGTGTVQIVSQNKTAAALTPTTGKQTIIADTGKVLYSVTVPALDAKYQDVSSVTATAGYVLTGYKFVNSSGTVVTGTMPNLGSISQTLDVLNSGSTGVSKTHSAGYTTGGTCSVSADIYNLLAAI
jgi:hypothetical protein